MECVHSAQQDSFREDIVSLKQSGTVQRESTLRSLSPYLDEQGIIRVGGRLQRSTFDFSVKHPMILADSHRLTRMIIWHYHCKAHLRAKPLLALLRSVGVWPLKGLNAVKTSCNKCFTCKRLFQQPVMPLMAPIPPDRLKPFNPPFTDTGIDYFGPLIVKIGRKTDKR